MIHLLLETNIMLATNTSYYQQFEEQQTQSLIDQRIKEHLGQTAAFQQQVGATFHQHLASFSNSQRHHLPLLPPPVVPIAGSQPPVNSPLVPDIRPPILPRPVAVAPGAFCMELARQRCGSQFLSLAVSSLTKALESTCIRLPIVFMLLAQAEASLGSRKKWERNLSLEWYSWPAEMRPAELYFQMHLLARQSTVVPDQFSCVKSFQSPQRWILRAIHLNPSCSRYWKVLQKVVECE